MMRFPCRGGLALLSAILAASVLHAGGPEGYVVERVPLDQGVPLHLTYCISQTQDGFLWFGTMYGLVRFDGYSYRSFRYDPDDPGSISNDDVIALLEDRNGYLWVGTYGGGLNRFDRSSGVFHRFLSDSSSGMDENTDIIWSIAEDQDGTIWSGTERGGLVGVHGDGSVIQYLHEERNPGSLQTNRVPSLDIDQSNQIWLINERGGLYSLRPGAEGPTRISSDEQANLRNLQTLCVDGENRLWVGSSTEGITVIDPVTGGTLAHHALKRIGGHTFEQTPRVSVLQESGDERMSAGTSVGVILLNPDLSEDLLFLPDRTDPRSIYNTRIVAMEYDQSGILWVASYFGGLSRIHHSPTGFDQFLPDPMALGGSSVNRIRAVSESRTGEVLAVNGESLYSIAFPSRKFRKLRLPKEITGQEIVLTSLFQDSRGTIWLGTDKGLYRLSSELEIVAVYTNRGPDPKSISSNGVNVISEDRQGRVWVGTNRGLNQFSYDNEKVRQYRAGKGSLRDEFIISLFADSKGDLWVGTYGGTTVLDTEKGTMRHYVQKSNDPTGISSNYAHCFIETGDGALWIGTGGGLNRFNSTDGTFSHYFERDGLKNNVIAGMAVSHDGMLWISTQNGITRFDPESGSFANFDVAQGLAGHMFTPGAGITTASGEIVFGGANGVTLFAPANITASRFQPSIALTDFSLIGGTGPLARPVHSGDSLSLDHDQNFFRVEFASLDLRNPAGNRYSYMLEGVDAAWSDWGESREAVYTDLRPGSYWLRVRGTNGDGVQSNQEASLLITITPPFWKTWWFYFLLCAIGIAVLVLFHHARVRERLRRAEELQQVRLEEAERIRKKAARDFHDEFGHRLTKIGLFAEIVKRQVISTSPETAARIDKIIDSSQALTNDTRDFLWTLDPANDSLFDLIEYLNRFGEELFDRTGISFRVASTAEGMKEIRLTMDFRRHLALILKEAMNNALRHSHGTTIDFSTTVSANEFRLSLSDDGTGLVGEAVPRGNGMKNMRLRAKRINGAIDIASGPGQGTRVVFTANAA